MSGSVISALAQLNNGMVTVAAAGEPVRLWQPDLRHPAESIVAYNTSGGLGFSVTTDAILAFGNDEIFRWLWSGSDWQPQDKKPLGLPPGWKIITASGDGRFIVLSAAYSKTGPDNVIRLQLDNGERVLLDGFQAKLPQAAIDPTGKWLGITDFEKPLRVAIWNLANPKGSPRILEVIEATGGRELSVSSSTDQIAVTTLNGCVYLWRSAKDSNYRTFCSRDFMPGSVALDGPDSRLAAGTLKGMILILRETDDSLIEEQTLYGHKGAITALAFDHTGRWLVSSSSNGEMRVWDTRTWQTIGTMQDPDDSFVRQILATGHPARIMTLTQGGRRLSEWTLDPEELANRVRAFAHPIEENYPN